MNVPNKKFPVFSLRKSNYRYRQADIILINRLFSRNLVGYLSVCQRWSYKSAMKSVWEFGVFSAGLACRRSPRSSGECSSCCLGDSRCPVVSLHSHNLPHVAPPLLSPSADPPVPRQYHSAQHCHLQITKDTIQIPFF